MANFQHLLVPVDFSETSEAALDSALALAKKLGARVTALHAFQIPIYGFPDGTLVATAEWAASIVAGSTAALSSLVESRKNAGVELHSALKQGETDEEINRFARENAVDLIVMGTHGRRGLSRALLGSVTEKIIRTAPCPVMTVHHQEKTEKK